MAERKFFRPSWINKVIKFPADDTIPTQSQWRIVKKLNEKCTQEDEEDWELFDHISSRAIALFECVDLGTNESAFMKIYIQIPYTDSEIYLPEERAQQALPNAEINEHIALLTMTKMKCKSTPTLIAWKREIQDDLGLVPGGYIVYLVTKKMPGMRLSIDTFWTLSRDQRDEIRAAFKVAWLDFTRCGIENYRIVLRNMLWDQATKQIFVIDFELSDSMTEQRIWSNSLWLRFARLRRVQHPYGKENLRKDGSIDETKWEL